MKQHTKETFKIYWNHSKKYKWSALGIFAFIALADAGRLAVPYFYKKIVDALTAGDPMDVIVRYFAFALATALVHHVSIRVALYCNSYFQTRMMKDLAVMCFSYLHHHSVRFFNNNFVGSLVKRVNRFYRAFEGVADRITWDLFPVIYNIVLVTIVLTLTSPLFGGIIVVWLFFHVALNYAFSQFKLKYDIQRSELDSVVTGRLADTVTNHSNLKLFNGYRREVAEFDRLSTKLNNLRRFTWDLANHFEIIQGLLMILVEFSMLYAAVLLWQEGKVTVGDFVLIQAYLGLIFHKLWDFGRVIRDFYENLADAEEMTEILATPHEIVDSRRATPLVVENGKVVFDSVNFSYNKTRKIIADLNLTIKPKEKVAFVGHSGAGKSTIVKLLLRNHDVTKGKILIDGQKISLATLESLWKNVSYVPQDSILFHRTLMENIRYARPEASDEEVVAAAKAAHAHEFIQELSEGYQTYVGERGVKLSGGERQRVAIARAILKNAPILVLDEATSSLDSESEQLIQDALDTLMKDKTVIVIAHRLSTIMKMDRILVVEGGVIVEEGSHKQLLKKKNGFYKKLWDIQAGDFMNE